jgi:hypothetical protein
MSHEAVGKHRSLDAVSPGRNRLADTLHALKSDIWRKWAQQSRFHFLGLPLSRSQLGTTARTHDFANNRSRYPIMRMYFNYLHGCNIGPRHPNFRFF